MTDLRLTAVLGLASLLVACDTRADNGSATAFGAFGLLGTWSPDCLSPPSPDNPRVYWEASPDGSVTHRVTFDDKTCGLIDSVSNVTIINAGLLTYSVIRNGEISLIVTLRRPDETVHTVTSVGADGTVYYDDGIEVATGKPALVSERCGLVSPLS